MRKKTSPKIGLALGSGGAKGLAHIGVLKTLEKYHIPIDYISGSSIGALIGAYYATHQDIISLENLIFEFNRKKGFSLLDLTMKGGLVKGKKTEKFIKELIGDATFSSLNLPFTAVATDITTAEAVILSKGDLTKSIRASISIPAFYQPISYNNKILADGGLSNSVPVDVVSQMGADLTIAVNLDTVYYEKELEAMPALAHVPVHSINILRHNLAKHTAKPADVIITPKDVMHIGLLGWNYFFDNKKATRIIKAGEEATEQMIPLLQEAIISYQKRNSRIGKFVSFFKSFKK